MIVAKPKKTPVDDKAAEAFIKGAPDAANAPGDKPKAKHVIKGKKVQITHTLPLELLERVDAMFGPAGLSSRASFINMAIVQMLQRGASIDGEAKE